jgi:hypothetical protein
MIKQKRTKHKKWRESQFGSRVARFFLVQHTKTGKYVPRWPQSMYIKWPYNIRNGSKIDQMAIKFTNIIHCKTLQNLPKLVFLGWKYTIWQRCLEDYCADDPCAHKNQKSNFHTWRRSNITKPYFFKLPPYTYIPWRDSNSRPIASIILVTGGDDTTRPVLCT